jgi:hypothetical protein
MRAFSVTVRTLEQRFAYPAIATSSADVHADAQERFGGLCSVVVRPSTADDDALFTGFMRVRVSAPDPLSGLRGSAYIAARKLGQWQRETIKAQEAAEADAEAEQQRIKSINQRPASAGQGRTNIVFMTGSADPLPGVNGNRRFMVVSSLKGGKP